jgi:hypothetical protein
MQKFTKKNFVGCVKDHFDFWEEDGDNRFLRDAEAG